MLRSFTALTLFLMTALPMSAAPAASSPAPLAGPASSPPGVDLLPLKKALAPLGAGGVLQSHSTLRMTATRQAVSVVLQEDLQILSRRPGRFHASLIQYDASGGPQKKLAVVSNGVSVWTYRPGLRQYSVLTLPAFKQADSDIPTLGLVIGGFYLGDGHPFVEGLRSVTAANNAAVLSDLSRINITLARQTKSVGNQDDYVYSLSFTKQNLKYQFYVNTQTGALTRVDLMGAQGDIEVSYREDIQSITPQPPAPNATFVFTPPPGVAKAADVSINPF